MITRSQEITRLPADSHHHRPINIKHQQSSSSSSANSNSNNDNDSRRPNCDVIISSSREEGQLPHYHHPITRNSNPMSSNFVMNSSNSSSANHNSMTMTGKDKQLSNRNNKRADNKKNNRQQQPIGGFIPPPHRFNGGSGGATRSEITGNSWKEQVENNHPSNRKGQRGQNKASGSRTGSTGSYGSSLNSSIDLSGSDGTKSIPCMECLHLFTNSVTNSGNGGSERKRRRRAKKKNKQQIKINQHENDDEQLEQQHSNSTTFGGTKGRGILGRGCHVIRPMETTTEHQRQQKAASNNSTTITTKTSEERDELAGQQVFSSSSFSIRNAKNLLLSFLSSLFFFNQTTNQPEEEMVDEGEKIDESTNYKSTTTKTMSNSLSCYNLKGGNETDDVSIIQSISRKVEEEEVRRRVGGEARTTKKGAAIPPRLQIHPMEGQEEEEDEDYLDDHNCHGKITKRIDGNIPPSQTSSSAFLRPLDSRAIAGLREAGCSPAFIDDSEYEEETETANGRETPLVHSDVPPPIPQLPLLSYHHYGMNTNNKDLYFSYPETAITTSSANQVKKPLSPPKEEELKEQEEDDTSTTTSASSSVKSVSSLSFSCHNKPERLSISEGREVNSTSISTSQVQKEKTTSLSSGSSTKSSSSCSSSVCGSVSFSLQNANKDTKNEEGERSSRIELVRTTTTEGSIEDRSSWTTTTGTGSPFKQHHIVQVHQKQKTRKESERDGQQQPRYSSSRSSTASSSLSSRSSRTSYHLHQANNLPDEEAGAHIAPQSVSSSTSTSSSSSHSNAHVSTSSAGIIVQPPAAPAHHYGRKTSMEGQQASYSSSSGLTPLEVESSNNHPLNYIQNVRQSTTVNGSGSHPINETALLGVNYHNKSNASASIPPFYHSNHSNNPTIVVADSSHNYHNHVQPHSHQYNSYNHQQHPFTLKSVPKGSSSFNSNSSLSSSSSSSRTGSKSSSSSVIQASTSDLLRAISSFLEKEYIWPIIKATAGRGERSQHQQAVLNGNVNNINGSNGHVNSKNGRPHTVTSFNHLFPQSLRGSKTDKGDSTVEKENSFNHKQSLNQYSPSPTEISLLSAYSSNDIISWLRAVDRSLLVQGWQDLAFISPSNLVFFFMLLRRTLECNRRDIERSQSVDNGNHQNNNHKRSIGIMNNRVRPASTSSIVSSVFPSFKKDMISTTADTPPLPSEPLPPFSSISSVKHWVLTCLYLSYSYEGNEISYPLKPFLDEETGDKRDDFFDRVLIVMKESSRDMLEINRDPRFFTQVFTDLLTWLGDCDGDNVNTGHSKSMTNSSHIHRKTVVTIPQITTDRAMNSSQYQPVDATMSSQPYNYPRQSHSMSMDSSSSVQVQVQHHQQPIILSTKM